MCGRKRISGVVPPIAAALAAPIVALAMSTAVAAAPTATQGQADSYALGASVQLLNGTPTKVGPIAPAAAYAPPTSASSGQAATFSCSTAGSSHCVSPAVDAVQVTADTAKVALATSPTTDCAPGSLPIGFDQGPLTGADACSQIAHLAALGTTFGLTQSPDALEVDTLTAQSITQGCTGAPMGRISIAQLVVAGQVIIGGSSAVLPTNTPAPNTYVSLSIGGTLILNEQHPDSQGHGLVVNAIHLFGAPTIGQYVAHDLIVGHVHSEVNCISGTTDTGTLPCPPSGSGGCPVPVVTKTDSTKHANPGETVIYTITVDTKGCTVTRVTDVLPPSFTYVSGSASGPLGPPALGTAPGTQQSQLEWYNGQGFSATSGLLTETIQATVSKDASPGQYVNNVDGQSAPALGGSGCGAFHGEDFIPVSTGPAANNGDNPGVIVPRPAGAVQALQTPQAPVVAPVSKPAGRPAAASTLPNTSATATGMPAGSGVLALLFLGALARVARRRRAAGC